MMKVPTLTASRVVQVWNEMVSCRRDYCADEDFFRMTDVWSYLTESSDTWRIKLFSSNLGDDYRRKAAVMSFGDRVTLTVDREVWNRAEKGGLFAGFMLSHELGHVALGHHARSASTKNFKLAMSESGMHSIIPPNVEELEANLAAVIFQCGPALLDPSRDIVDLAKRAHTDIGYAKKVRKLLLTTEVQRELNKPKLLVQRITL